MQSKLSASGDLTISVIRAKKAPLLWRFSNALRVAYIKGWIAKHLIVPFANWWGVATSIAELRAIKIDGLTGEKIDYGILGWRVVTNAGVAFMVDAWDNAGVNLEDLNYHGCGTGTNAENATDTALQTESTTALNPNSTRATGTRSQPAANQYRSVGTLTFDTDAAVTEHGLLSQAATGGGTLWDRTVFSAINVVGANGDSIQFTYTATLTAGG